MDLNLHDKVAIVTGGGRGIGEAICIAFAIEGAHVVVVDIDGDAAKTVSNRIKKTTRKSMSLAVNVSRKEEVTTMMKRVTQEFGRIDCLVNNAGISPKKDGGLTLTWEISENEWDTVLRVNLAGPLFCSQEAIKYMLPRKSGTIVNIASMAGKTVNEPMPTGAHYNSSKAAVINLTQTLARDLAPHGIRANAIAPGRILTPLAKLASDEANQAMLNRIPMGRFGTPVEIANLALFLSSEVSSFITGETVNINGGWFMG